MKSSLTLFTNDRGIATARVAPGCGSARWRDAGLPERGGDDVTAHIRGGLRGRSAEIHAIELPS